MPSTSNALDVLAEPGPAATALHPLRRRILGELREPSSATAVAERLGLPRQKVNYHVRLLEASGLVEEVERRRKGNCVERIVRATARHYLVAPDVLGELGDTPEEARDRFSSAWSVAVAARTVREVASMRVGAEATGKKLPTLTLDADVRFATPAAQMDFANDLVDTFNALVARHHDAGAPEGRGFRVVFQGYPSPAPPPEQAGARPARGDDS